MTVTELPDHVPADLIVDFDIYDHTRAGRIHEDMRWLLDHKPVSYTLASGGHWIFTRYEDIHAVLRDPHRFSSFPTAVPREVHEQQKLIPIMNDPPEHGAYRQMINPLFAPGRVKELEADIRQLVVGLLDRIGPAGACEFVSEFARPLPSTVFLILMGWSLEDAPTFQRWAHYILTDIGAKRDEAMAGVFGYFGQLIADRRANPQDDFTSLLVNGLYGNERVLRDDELLNMLLLLMLGGLHTVQGALSYSINYFAEHPELRDRMVADPSVIPGAVEEMLRWEAPAWPCRRATEDVQIAGVTIRKDEMVLLVFTAANHDEAEFPGSEEVDLAREPNRHLAFSSGPHRCIGSHLARLEMRIALEEIHRRMPDYRLDPDRPPVRHLSGVNGLEHLHITYSPFS